MNFSPFHFLPPSYIMPLPMYPYQFMHVAPHHLQNPVRNPMEAPAEVQIIQEKSSLSLEDVDMIKFEQKLKEVHFGSNQNKKVHWKPQEDRLLGRLVQIDRLQWKQIPKYFENRTQNMCYSRYRRISLGARDKSWTKQDQKYLLNCVQKFGEKWKMISKKMAKFSAKQVRDRYLNYLRPNITHQEFTLQEDLKLCRFVLTHGRYWRKMEQFLPGKSQSSIKGRFYGKLQKILMTCLKSESQD